MKNNNNHEDIKIKNLRFKLGWLQNKFEEFQKKKKKKQEPTLQMKKLIQF